MKRVRALLPLLSPLVFIAAYADWYKGKLEKIASRPIL
jgi:hypothetical protein